MNFSQYLYLVRTDLYRWGGSIRFRSFLFHIALTPGFQYAFWMRTCAYMRTHRLVKFPWFFIAKLIQNHYTYKYGIDISDRTQIGSGFYIGHFGGITVNARAVIGKNCNISQGVTIGVSNRGKRKGYPQIGDQVYIGPGAKIFGNVKIGNNVAIGANCVVTSDIPDCAVVVGVPGKVISDAGSLDYVEHIDYDRLLRAASPVPEP